MAAGLKRSSGREYQRLSQAADSDEEISLYPLSPPSFSPTEFGRGSYDQTRDLELPAPLRGSPGSRRGKRGRRRRAGELGVKRLHARDCSREARACVCFVGLLLAALAVVVIAWLHLGEEYGSPELPYSPPHYSTLSLSPVETPAGPTTQPTTEETSPTSVSEGTPVTEEEEEEERGSIAGDITHETTLTTAADTAPPTVEGAREAISWEREFFPAVTETALQLCDLSGDGVGDVVMTEARGQCEMIVRVLDGLNGHTVWEANTSYDAFAVRCGNDLNRDGLVDCIAAGRQSGLRALDGSDGSTLWDRDPRVSFINYNFYFPLFVPDLDGDGVVDIIATHGGDSSYGEEDIDRSPGFLTVISGQTGRQLMERLPLPDGRETYNSPVFLPRGSGEGGDGDMVLVGTGGETLPGALWGFSYSNLKERVSRYLAIDGGGDYVPFTGYVNHLCTGDMTRQEIERERPVFDGGEFDRARDTLADPNFTHCPPWGQHRPVWNKYNLCVYELISGREKGVLLPPVIVEMTGDEQFDLVVSLFEGRTLVISGESGEVVWEVHEPETESYSIPAPLMFNSDAVPDLLVRINYGVWNKYNHSTIAILDGQNGDVLWSFDSVKTGMMSSLSLAALTPGADIALFITMGTTGSHSNTSQVDWRREVMEEIERTHSLNSSELVDPEKEEGEEGDGSGMLLPMVDPMAEAERYRDPPGLWEGAGREYPDPVTDLPSFLWEHCGWSEEELTASLYLLSPEQALSGYTPPLFSHGPFVYFPGYQEKRHGKPRPNHTHSDHTPRDLRCGHVMIPEMIVSTPAIGDLDGDGRLEVAYLVAWRGDSGGKAGQPLPPKFSLFVETLEGVGGLLPASQQPWTHYMGTRGDSIYSRHTP